MTSSFKYGPRVEIRRMGLIESANRRRWLDGWAVFVDGREQCPWFHKREAQRQAKLIASKLGKL
jgi:hypothetical protein